MSAKSFKQLSQASQDKYRSYRSMNVAAFIALSIVKHLDEALPRMQEQDARLDYSNGTDSTERFETQTVLLSL